MSGAAQAEGSGPSDATAKGLMPPYRLLHGFLDDDTAAALLAYAQAHEDMFEPTHVSRQSYGLDPAGPAEQRLDPRIRMSMGTRELGAFKPLLKAKVAALVPELVRALRVTPFDLGPIELELVAHGDGAFFRRHTDTQTTAYGRIRMLSGVYYLHAAPKAFDGGALRLYAIGSRDFVDIAPAHNTLLVFPSWAPHEVMTVRCPSGQFSDSRFAVNCWVYRKKPKRESP